jgi:hypothetical protein
MIEWDTAMPPLSVLLDEAQLARNLQASERPVTEQPVTFGGDE